MLCATSVWFFYEQIGQIHCLCLLAGCYLLQVKEVRTAGRLCFFYTILQVLARICAPHTALLYVILHTLARSIPLVMFAAAIVKSNPSRLMASWQSLHIPQSVTIMLCMMMRGERAHGTQTVTAECRGAFRSDAAESAAAWQMLGVHE